VKKVPAFIAGAFLLFTLNLQMPSAQAAVPAPEVSLTASASKVNNGSATWTNDGTIGGNATLGTYVSTAPTYSSVDTSVALNATSGQGQFITQSLGTVTAFSEATLEIYMKIPAAQANAVGSAGMVFGWSSTYYDIWMQNNNCIGFNTGTGEIYGFTLTSAMKDSFHYFTFVMSTNSSDSAKQVAYVDGVKQSLSFCYGSSSTASQKSFNGTSPGYNLGRYGTNNQFPGTLNLRGLKIWLRELADAQIKESYSSTLTPTSHTIALTSGLSTAAYRTNSTLRSTVDVEGKVTFFSNGKRIPGCINLQTVNKTVDCTWKPSVINYNNITAQLVAPGGSLATSAFRIFVTKRSGLR
jgi:hypothetical protein